MKLVICGDLHLDATTCGVARREEIKRAVMDGPVKAAVDGHADLFVFMGDLCNPGSRMAVSDVAFPIEVAKSLGDVPSLWIAGNHDVVMSDDGATTLDALSQCDVLPGGMTRRPGAFTPVSPVVQTRSPSVLIHQRVRFLALPYSHREQDRAITGAALKEVESGLPLVVLGHCTSIGGARGEGSEEAEFARGRSQPWPALPPGRIRRDVLFAACGHWHDQGEAVSPDGYKVHLVGSLVRLCFADSERTRGFTIVELEVT